jgi:phage terminase large subunit GpA-like protein
MRSQMELEIANRISKGLTRSAITKASDWAMQYRYIKDLKTGMPTLYKFDLHPWSLEMHDCPANHMVGQKAAQMAYTETAINRAFKSIDIDRQSVLYVLPTERPDAADFSSSRFDPALEMSPHLSNLFCDTKNLGLKRAGQQGHDHS